jgi:predicted amidohydrolase
LLAQNTVRVAAIQMSSTGDLAQNLGQAEALIHEAADRGARIAALPENFAFMGSDKERAGVAQPLDGPITTRLKQIAKDRSLVLVGGSFLEAHPDTPGKPFNTSVIIDPRGEIAGVYRKIHLFDVDLPGSPVYRESDHISPGAETVLKEIEGMRFGLSICYDLRFPELYRQLAQNGADFIFVPAAFTLMTGKDHWHPLLQARAIENQVYLIAPAQDGTHGKRQTYGHSVIVDPWGTILSQAPEGACVVTADCNLNHLREVRQRIPALSHIRKDLFFS